MQAKEDYVLKLLEDAGLVSRSKIEKAKARLNGNGNALELLIKEGAVSETDVSRSLAARPTWIGSISRPRSSRRK